MVNGGQFEPGDILELAGETYQLLENRESGGLIRPFPSDETEGRLIDWQARGEACRKIGTAPLPAPLPCAGGECPTDGRIEVSLDTKPKTSG